MTAPRDDSPTRHLTLSSPAFRDGESVPVRHTCDGDDLGYGGPCPPSGRPHRYFFRLYALDTALNLPPGVNRADLDAAMAGHVLAQGGIMGTYEGREGETAPPPE